MWLVRVSVSDVPADQNFDSVIKGTGFLFIGLVGGIFLFKAATSDKKREIFLGSGVALILASLILIFTISSAPTLG